MPEFSSPSEDRLDRIRKTHAEIVDSDGGECMMMEDIRWACDEIDRLRQELKMLTRKHTNEC